MIRPEPTKKDAFTLIELLVVISIIAILIAIAQPMLSSANARSREFECQTNLHQIGMALQTYWQDNGSYPKDFTQIKSLQDGSVAQCTETHLPYWYRDPGKNPRADTVIAACVDPGGPASGYPHRLLHSNIELTANGSVKRVTTGQ